MEFEQSRGNISIRNPWDKTDWGVVYRYLSYHDLGGYQRELTAIITHRLVDSLDLSCMTTILEMRDEPADAENLINNVIMLKKSQLYWIENELAYRDQLFQAVIRDHL